MRKRTETIWILLAAASAIGLRSPLLLYHGKVFQEEGSDYYQGAVDLSPLHALFAVHVGYFSLFMNGYTFLVERLVSVEWVSFAFTFCAFLMLLLTVYLAIEVELLEDWRSRALAATACVFVPSIEVWLALEDVQFYLAVCVALVCISSELRHRLLRTGVLFLASLTGPGSCVYTPFFLWRAYRRRTTMAYVQAAVITICSAIQAAVVLRSLRGGTRSLSGQEKLTWFGPVMFLKIFSVSFFTRLGAFLSQRIVLHHRTVAVCLLFWCLALLSGWLFWKAATLAGTAGKTLFLMALTSLLYNFIGTLESLDVIFIGAFRYCFTGFLLLWLTLVLAYSTRRTAPAAQYKLARGMLFLVLFCGMVDAVGYWTRFQGLSPPWRSEVALWRKDPSHGIHVATPSWPFLVHPPVGHR